MKGVVGVVAMSRYYIKIAGSNEIYDSSLFSWSGGVREGGRDEALRV